MGAYQTDRQETVRRIKEAADIAEVIGEHVSLKRAGANLKGLCPFHSEKTPSFIVSPARQTFHCFGCDEGGDVFSFLMRYHRLTFPEAVKELARRYQIPLPEEQLSAGDQARARLREALFQANRLAADLYHRHLLDSAQAAPARSYLAERGMPAEIISRFRLGFAPDRWDFLRQALTGAGVSQETGQQAGLLAASDRGRPYDRFRNRILFPIFDPTGRVVAFGGRCLGDGQPKYLNSPETPIFDKGRTLFGLYQAREAIRRQRQCLIVEGNFDLLTLAAHGLENVVAPLGTALTAHHLRQLRGYADEALLLFDGDQAGLTAAMRAVPLFLAEQLSARVAVLPDGEDPDSLLRNQGREALAQRLDQARPLAEFVFEQLVARHGLTMDGKAQIVAELRPLIAAIGDQHLQRSLFIAHFSEKLGLPQEQLLANVSSPGRKAARRAAPPRADGDQPLTLPANEEKLFAFLLLYPEYLPDFLAAGLDRVVASAAGTTLLELLRRESAEDAPGQGLTERLFLVAGDREKRLLSRLLVAAPAFGDDQIREESAREMIEMVRRRGIQSRKEQLVRQIDEAYRSHNQERWLELMAKKKEMDQAQGA